MKVNTMQDASNPIAHAWSHGLEIAMNSLLKPLRGTSSPAHQSIAAIAVACGVVLLATSERSAYGWQPTAQIYQYTFESGNDGWALTTGKCNVDNPNVVRTSGDGGAAQGTWHILIPGQVRPSGCADAEVLVMSRTISTVGYSNLIAQYSLRTLDNGAFESADYIRFVVNGTEVSRVTDDYNSGNWGTVTTSTWPASANNSASVSLQIFGRTSAPQEDYHIDNIRVLSTLTDPGLTATPNGGNIDLSWSDHGTNARYEIFRSAQGTTNGPWGAGTNGVAGAYDSILSRNGTTDSNGAVNYMLVIGPFGAAGSTDVGASQYPTVWFGWKGEIANYRPFDGMKHWNTTHTWTERISNTTYGGVNGWNLDALLSPNENVHAYLYVEMFAVSNTTWRFRMGSDDSIELWVDSTRYHQNAVGRGVSLDNDSVDVPVTAGWHNILFDITEGGGGWGVVWRITNTSNGPLSGIPWRIPKVTANETYSDPIGSGTYNYYIVAYDNTTDPYQGATDRISNLVSNGYAEIATSTDVTGWSKAGTGSSGNGGVTGGFDTEECNRYYAGHHAFHIWNASGLDASWRITQTLPDTTSNYLTSAYFKTWNVTSGTGGNPTGANGWTVTWGEGGSYHPDIGDNSGSTHGLGSGFDDADCDGGNNLKGPFFFKSDVFNGSNTGDGVFTLHAGINWTTGNGEGWWDNIRIDRLVQGGITDSLPTADSVTPSSGTYVTSEATPVWHTFTTVHSDANGFADITWCLLLFRDVVNGSNAVYVYYENSTNLLHLRSDDGSAWTGGFAPGSANVITNTRGRLNCKDTTVNKSGNSVTVNWSIQFRTALNGVSNWNTYLLTSDTTTGTHSGWQDRGDASFAANATPTSTSGTTSSATMTADGTTTYTVSTTCTDTNGGADIGMMLMLFNINPPTFTEPNGRGYLVWALRDNNANDTDTSGGSTINANVVNRWGHTDFGPATGGGHWGFNQSSWGPSYITPTACTTSVNANTRTVTWSFKINAAWGSAGPVTPNWIGSWTADRNNAGQVWTTTCNGCSGGVTGGMTSYTFTVNPVSSNTPPTVTNVNNQGAAIGGDGTNAKVNYLLQDAESDACSIAPQYRLADEFNNATFTDRFGSDPTDTWEFKANSLQAGPTVTGGNLTFTGSSTGAYDPGIAGNGSRLRFRALGHSGSTNSFSVRAKVDINTASGAAWGMAGIYVRQVGTTEQNHSIIFAGTEEVNNTGESWPRIKARKGTGSAGENGGDYLKASGQNRAANQTFYYRIDYDATTSRFTTYWSTDGSAWTSTWPRGSIGQSGGDGGNGTAEFRFAAGGAGETTAGYAFANLNNTADFEVGICSQFGVVASIDWFADATWHTATFDSGDAQPSGDGTTSLTASPGGVAHTFTWDVDGDLPIAQVAIPNAHFNITPSDTQTGTAGATSAGTSFKLPWPCAGVTAGATLTSPANAATDVSVTPTLTWNAATQDGNGTVSYRVFMDTNTTPTTDVSGLITSTTYNHSTALSSLTTYYWRVQASSSCGGSSVFSATRSFTTALEDATPPSIAGVLTSPTSATCDTTPDVSISVVDADAGLDVSTAQFQFSTDGGTTWRTSATTSNANGVWIGDANVLRASGTPTGAGNRYWYPDIALPNYTVEAGDVFMYDIYFPSTGTTFGAVDIEFDVGQLRGAGINDQNGCSAHPQTTCIDDGRADNKWYHREFDLTSQAGKVINSIEMALENDQAHGALTMYVRNVRIVNGSVIKLSVYQDESGFTPPADTFGPSITGYTGTTGPGDIADVTINATTAPVAACSGSDGTNVSELITASDVPFNQGSATLNRIRFRIADTAGNFAVSNTFTVNVDGTVPSITNITPSSTCVTTGTDISLTATVTDAQSTVNQADIYLLSDNLLTNPGNESSTGDGVGNFPGWSLSGAAPTQNGGQWDRDQCSFGPGNPCAQEGSYHFSAWAFFSGNYAESEIYQTVAVQPNTTYYFSGYYHHHSSSPDRTVRTRMKIRNGGIGAAVQATLYDSGTLAGVVFSDWTQVATTFTTAAGQTQLTFSASSEVGGSNGSEFAGTWFDNFEIRELATNPDTFAGGTATWNTVNIDTTKVLKIYAEHACDVGNSLWSVASSATVQTDDAAPATAITPFSPTCRGAGNVNVVWSATDSCAGMTGGASEVLLYVRPPGGNWGDSGLPAKTGTGGGNAFVFTPGAGDGQYFFQVVATDRLGNAQTPPSGGTGNGQATITRDTQAPTTAISPALPSCVGTGNITVNWTASDNGCAGTTGGSSAIRLYVLTPGGSWANSGLSSQQGASGAFAYTPSAGDGTYYFRIVGTDNVGNAETAPTGSDTGLAHGSTTRDTTGPTSSIAPALASCVGGGNISVPWSVSVAGCGVMTGGQARVRLFVRAPSANWADSGLTPQTGTSGSFNYAPAAGDGQYFFQIVARDSVGNEETAPSGGSGTGQDNTTRDTADPSTNISPALAACTGSNNVNVQWTASDTGCAGLTGGSSAVVLYVRKAGGSWANSGLSAQTGTAGTFNYVASQGDGNYFFQVVAIDAVGNDQTPPAGSSGNGQGTTNVDTVTPTVQIHQKASAPAQADPTNQSPILFTVIFSKEISGFTTGDVDLSLSTATGTLVGTVTEIAPFDTTTYEVSVAGMTGDGNVIAVIQAGVATDCSGRGNLASAPTTVANAATEISGTQGQDGWRYGFHFAGQCGNFTELNPANYNGGFATWFGTQSFGTPKLDPNGGHPGVDDLTQAVRRWTSDVSGTVRIEGTHMDRDTGCGDGAHVRINKNCSQIFEYLNTPGTQTPYSLTTTVNVGDTIDFIIDPKFDAGCDDTEFTALITLLPTIDDRQVKYDTTKPNVTVVAPNGSPSNVSPVQFNITFDEPIRRNPSAGAAAFVIGDVTVTGGTKGPLIQNDGDTETASSFTVNVTPNQPTEAPVNVSLSIPADVTTDPASNLNNASNLVTVNFDGKRPSVTMSVEVAGGGAVTSGSTINDTDLEFTLTFSEDVSEISAGIIRNGLQISDGGATKGAMQTISASQYLIPVDLAGAADGLITFQELNDVAQDAHTNTNTASAVFSITLDKTAPTIDTVAPAEGVNVQSLTSIDVTFTEAVTGVDASDLTVNGGAATGVSGSGAGPYTFTVNNPPDGIVNVVFSAGGIEDGPGNPFAGDSWTYAKGTPPGVSMFGSARLHGGAGDISLDLNPTSHGLGGSEVIGDPRLGVVNDIRIDLDQPCEFAGGGTIAAAVVFEVGSGASGPWNARTHNGVNLLNGGTQIQVLLPTSGGQELANGEYARITIQANNFRSIQSGLWLENNQATALNTRVRSLEADTTFANGITSSDVSAIRSAILAELPLSSTSAQYDVNKNGLFDTLDMAIVKTRIGG